MVVAVPKELPLIFTVFPGINPELSIPVTRTDGQDIDQPRSILSVILNEAKELVLIIPLNKVEMLAFIGLSVPALDRKPRDRAYPNRILSGLAFPIILLVTV